MSSVVAMADRMQQERTLPHNIEAEQGLLGAILINNEAFDLVHDLIDEWHFYEPLHSKIFEVIKLLLRGNKKATPITLATYLPVEMDIGGITLGRYLARLCSEATTVINAVDYAELIVDLAMRRDLISISEGAIDAASTMIEPVGRQIEALEQRWYDIAAPKRGGGFQRFASALTEAIDMTARAYQADGGLSGLSTGLLDLDGKMGGLQPSDLIIAAGRPGMGKTGFVTGMAYAAASHGIPVGFFSLEMSAEQLATRMIAEQSGVSSHRMRRGQYDEGEFDRIVAATNRLDGLPLYIDDTGAASMAQVAARARRLNRRGLGLLIVDYLQLITSTSKGASFSREREVSEISTGLKALAKELRVPIVAVSQLSRKVEERDEKRPQLSDLRESGSIEQDADVVMFLYREEYYHQMAKPSEANEERFAAWLAKGEQVQGRAEIILAKHRHGPTGTVEVQFDAPLTRFANLDTQR